MEDVSEAVQMLQNESEVFHRTASRLSDKRGKHHPYMFGQASGLAMAAELLRENYGDS